MAENKWKLGDLEFDSKQEYFDATKDLKKIKQIMEKHDVTDPAEARKVLKEVSEKPVFVSSYGMKFVEKLEKAAAEEKHASVADDLEDTKKKKKKPQKEKKVHIITRRNILIGAVLIAVLAAARFIVPQVFPGFMGEQVGEKEDIRRNLVLAYAKNQVELQTSFYNYYKNVLGEDHETALTHANSQLAEAYCINLADEKVSGYSDEQIEEIYVKLITAGELVNNAFNEPQPITDLKAVIAQSAAAGVPGSSTEETPAGEVDVDVDNKVNLVNKMMDYQQRTAAQFAYNYGQFDFDESEIREYVIEDMEKTFGYVIYDMKLGEGDKEAYYNAFQQAGFFDDGTLVRSGTNPIEHNLPDLTPTVKIKSDDGKEETVTCSQQTLVPVASVAYELHKDKKKGYLILRGNGDGIGFVQDDDGNSVTVQGDFFLNWNGKTTRGEWYYNRAHIGFLISEQKAGGIENVYDLVY